MKGRPRSRVGYLTAVPFMLLMITTLMLGLATSAQAANPRYASIVVDAATGEVLHGENATATRYPASLTKMMTLYLLFEALEEGRVTPDQALPVSSYAASKPASKLWLPAGSSITVREAIPALVIRSANDVATVVAEALGGSESGFARQMNAKARELDMISTHFRNPSGLPDPEQVSTARDMAILSVRLMNDFPQYYHHFSRTSFVYKGKTHNGHNRLLKNYAGADGLKTGYINASGFNVATSAVREGRRLIAVVMGGFTAQSRDAHMAELLDRGFMRASMATGNDWVASADVSGNVEPLPASAPVRMAELIDAEDPISVATAGVSDSDAARNTDDGLAGEGATSVDDEDTFAAASGSDAQAADDIMTGSDTRLSDDPIMALISQSESQAAVGGDWAVQVGAFEDPGRARNTASQAADYLQDSLQPTVDITEGAADQHKVFRARLVDMEEREARQACEQLFQQGIDCMVVR
ncbi:D-alanyl-D-alanine carboxypeptidase [Aidingimonas halophila]|uniref:D-alanyl-D-alanine carboxypeptidase n=1 Tax=Aidingimonas halophila TaxID=574349 RepID=A0A1H3FHX8_9GAMM|nr:D-alanyl-D-alanine carboxypeptidase [Aidingimonas halophila]GHC37834.1 peptidase S11 [Aidingimonas halophila]SDX90445.1 D-alanyl-D-alanine carboxypeptidase [Aidingimonas halophila]